MSQRVRAALITGVVVIALVASVIVLPDGLRWIPLVVLALLIALNVVAFVWAMRHRQAAGGGIAALHPDSAVLPTTLLALEGSAPADRARVVAVVADAHGLSFRDAGDGEVAAVQADRILAIEVAPLDPRSAVRPIRVSTIDGVPVDFWGGASPEQQVDAVVALREALGRGSG